jgi:uncharacterized protein (TIGR00297 family)
MPEAHIQFSLVSLLIGFGLSTTVGGIAWRLGMLSADGWFVASLVGGITFGLGGLHAAILLLAFFASSSLLSRTFSNRKTQVAVNFAKGGRRDCVQVAANGGVATLSLIASAMGWVSEPTTWIIFASALAAVTADTWATEIGVLSAGQPRLITTGKRVPRGTSGGISLLGSLIALIAAFVIAISAWLLGMTTIAFTPLITLCGLAGSFVDSALGATVQAIYFCQKCKKETERHPLHFCGTPTTLHRGWHWLDNDWVNFLSAAFGALLAAVIFVLFV